VPRHKATATRAASFIGTPQPSRRSLKRHHNAPQGSVGRTAPRLDPATVRGGRRAHRSLSKTIRTLRASDGASHYGGLHMSTLPTRRAALGIGTLDPDWSPAAMRARLAQIGAVNSSVRGTNTRRPAYSDTFGVFVFGPMTSIHSSPSIVLKRLRAKRRVFCLCFAGDRRMIHSCNVGMGVTCWFHWQRCCFL
jgi:hypothetical protein